MDTLLSVAAVFALSIPVAFAFALFVARGPELLAGFFGPVPNDGWPRGVQEEDPSFDTTFRLGPGAAQVSRIDEEGETVPPPAPTGRVSGSVRRRVSG